MSNNEKVLAKNEQFPRAVLKLLQATDDETAKDFYREVLEEVDRLCGVKRMFALLHDHPEIGRPAREVGYLLDTLFGGDPTNNGTKLVGLNRKFNNGWADYRDRNNFKQGYTSIEDAKKLVVLLEMDKLLSQMTASGLRVWIEHPDEDETATEKEMRDKLTVLFNRSLCGSDPIPVVGVSYNLSPRLDSSSEFITDLKDIVREGYHGYDVRGTLLDAVRISAETGATVAEARDYVKFLGEHTLSTSTANVLTLLLDEHFPTR